MRTTSASGFKLTLISSVFFSFPAFSADLSYRPVEMAADVELVYFSGFYAGIHGGYGRTHDFAPVVESAGNQAPGLVSGTLAINEQIGDEDNGFVGGAQIGYNYNFSTWVIGAEADISFFRLKSEGSFTASQSIIMGLSDEIIEGTVSHRLNWFGTMRARAGFILDNNTMLYGTAGLAFGHTKSEMNLHSSYDTGFFGGLIEHDVLASDSGMALGWTIGGGVEYALSQNWSIKAEYLYIDLGNDTFEASVTPGQVNNLPVPTDTVTYTATSDNRFSVIRAGLNYRF